MAKRKEGRNELVEGEGEGEEARHSRSKSKSKSKMKTKSESKSKDGERKEDVVGDEAGLTAGERRSKTTGDSTSRSSDGVDTTPPNALGEARELGARGKKRKAGDGTVRPDEAETRDLEQSKVSEEDGDAQRSIVKKTRKKEKRHKMASSPSPEDGDVAIEGASHKSKTKRMKKVDEQDNSIPKKKKKRRTAERTEDQSPAPTRRKKVDKGHASPRASPSSSSSPSHSSEDHVVAQDAPTPAQTQDTKSAFETFYLRRITTEYGDELEKLRAGRGGKADSATRKDSNANANGEGEDKEGNKPVTGDETEPGDLGEGPGLGRDKVKLLIGALRQGVEVFGVEEMRTVVRRA